MHAMQAKPCSRTALAAPRFLIAALVLAVLPIEPGAAGEARHAIAMHGEPAYGSGFTHFRCFVFHEPALKERSREGFRQVDPGHRFLTSANPNRSAPVTFACEAQPLRHGRPLISPYARTTDATCRSTVKRLATGTELCSFFVPK